MPESMTPLLFDEVYRAIHALGYPGSVAAGPNAESSPEVVRSLTRLGRDLGMVDIAISRQDAMGNVLLIRPKALVDRIAEINRDLDRDWTGTEVAARIEETFQTAAEFARKIQRAAAARVLTRRVYDTYLQWLVRQGNLRRQMIAWLDTQDPGVLAEAARRSGQSILDFRARLEEAFPQTTVQRGALVGQESKLPPAVAWGIVKLVMAAFALAAVALVVKLAAVVGHHWTVIARKEIDAIMAGVPPEDIIALRRAREEPIPWTLGLVVIGAIGAGYLLVQWQKGRASYSEAA
jgi:hypothetical protein